MERLPADYEISLFRIVQECLTNIHRHSGSTTALVNLRVTPELAILQVSDDGVGIKGDLKETSGVGLRGMRERMRQLGGSLQIDSGEQGTRIRASLPMSHIKAANTRSNDGDAVPT
jgi:signal transduction histidine kinase